MNQKVFFEGEFGKICGILNLIENSTEIAIVIHGFSSTKDNTSGKIIEEEFSQLNISTLRIDLDNQGESDLEFKYGFVSNYITQVNSAIAYCQSLGFKHISLIGGSYGGVVTLAVAAQRDDLKRLFLRCPGIGTFYYQYLKDKTSQNYIDVKNGGTINTHGEEFDIEILNDMEQYYPLTQLAKQITIPTGIVHGTKDETIPYEDTIEFSKEIENCELTIINGASHNLGVGEDFSEWRGALVEFFNK
ncbi:MAG: alpha/beta hydrolase [Candidatus Nanoarchaeia archaeon]